MKYLFDTSSLLAISRYYLPFDREKKLYKRICARFLAGDIVILDTILNEGRYVAQGVILRSFPFLLDKKDLIINTSDLLPFSTRKFDNLVNNNFSVSALVNNGKVDFSMLKQNFLASGDGKIIVYAYNKMHEGEKGFCVVTEETPFPNDGKVFKKLPALCDIIDVPHMNVVSLLERTTLRLDF